MTQVPLLMKCVLALCTKAVFVSISWLHIEIRIKEGTKETCQVLGLTKSWVPTRNWKPFSVNFGVSPSLKIEQIRDSCCCSYILWIH
jgi:hypothetical protein